MIIKRSDCFFILFLASTFLFSCNSKKTLFTLVSSEKSNIRFENLVAKNDHLNILYYLYYYNGGGVSVGDINNDGLPDIYFTANSKGNNKLYLNKGNFVFEDITEQAGVKGNADWCSGVTMADVNGDGFLDIYVSVVAKFLGLEGHNELYINNGDKTFTESAIRYGLDLSGLSTQAGFFDYDHDGDLDCYILRHSRKPHENIKSSSFRSVKDSISGDRIFRNDLNTTGKFKDVSDITGIFQSNIGYGLGLAIADINNDGWDDVYIGNDFQENDYYYINNGDGTFTESGAKHFRHYSRFSMGNDVADYNNDGQLDVVTVDMLPPDEKTLKTYGSDENPDIYTMKLEANGYQHQYSKNCLQRNNGDGASFSELGLMSGISATDWSWAPLFADFDNDGYKDLFVSSGIVHRPVDLDYVKFISDQAVSSRTANTNTFDDKIIATMPDGSSHPFLFKGNGDAAFEDVSDDWGLKKLKGYFNGAAYADLDNDGDLDIVINCINSKAVVLKNNSEQRNHLRISFDGDSMNKFGVGAKAYLFTKGTLQYQQLMLTRGFQSSVDTRLYFGLDSVSSIDSILIVWPNQKFEVVKNVPSNKELTVLYKNASGIFSYKVMFPRDPELYSPADIALSWKHLENNFNDFNVQYLIPHIQSTRGPKIAVADVDNDGLDDFYVCGAKTQAGGLFLQQGNGSFIAADTAIFNADASCEDVDAVFFDANGDKAPDLYVVTGGNEPIGTINYTDRLYLNDGKGHFTKSSNALSPLNNNNSCIAVADIDNDGDNDIFLGVLADPVAFGLPKTSYLLINDDKGHFSVANNKTIQLDTIGMVTSASFADLNKDGWNDLVVTGEWMGIKIYMNDHGIFTSSEISGSTGLWQTIFTTDVNGDGSIDILAGNWGHNSKLFAGKEPPLKLYVKDFDNNKSIEQVMCYNISGEEYSFLAKDELERRMPLLKKEYLTYSEVAGKTVQYMFYNLFTGYKESKAEVLASSCFINDGKGNFNRMDLPAELQLAPVMSFTATDRPGTFIAAGNFFGTMPYEGRYDALIPTLFSFDKNKRIFESNSHIAMADGEIRDMKWIRTVNNDRVLALGRNNQSILFLKKK